VNIAIFACINKKTAEDQRLEELMKDPSRLVAGLSRKTLLL
jgi:hypothetical protein